MKDALVGCARGTVKEHSLKVTIIASAECDLSQVDIHAQLFSLTGLWSGALKQLQVAVGAGWW